MSLREFGAHLGVSARMISKWESGGVGIRPRLVNQCALDTSLATAGTVAQARFIAALSPPPSPSPRPAPPLRPAPAHPEGGPAPGLVATPRPVIVVTLTSEQVAQLRRGMLTNAAAPDQHHDPRTPDIGILMLQGRGAL